MSKRTHTVTKAGDSPKKMNNYPTVKDEGNVRLIEFSMTYSDEEDDGRTSKKMKTVDLKEEIHHGDNQEIVNAPDHEEEVTEVAEHQEVTEEDASLDSRLAEIHGVEAGQHYLQIVDDDEGNMTTQIVDGATLTQSDGSTVVQGDQFVEIDLMNIRLIRYEGEDCAQEVITDGSEMDGVVVTTTEDGQEQRYLHLNGITEEGELGEQVAVLQEDSDHLQRHGRSSTNYQYVQVVEKDSVPLVFYTSTPPAPPIPNSRMMMPRNTNRKRRDFTLTTELIESPKFKLFLYNCKQCDFKCNAIKELTAHRQVHQIQGSSRFRSFPKPPPISTFQPSSPEPDDSSKYNSGSMRDSHSRYHNSDMMKSERKLSILSSKHNMQSLYHCEKCDLKTKSRHTYKRHDCKGRCSVP